MRIFSGLLPASLLFATTPLLAEQLCPSPPGQPAAYKIGLSQLSITPMNKLTIAGYGTYYGLPSATRMSHEGTHDPIFASTFWVETDTERALAIVSLDLVGISRPTVLRVEEEVKRTLGRSNVQVILSATHTHHAPDVLGLWGALPFFTGRDEPYMNFLEKSIVASIKSASDTARCSQVHWAETHKETDWHNYLPAGSEHEETITTLSFVDPLTQQSLGTLTQWAAHPTVLEANNNTISSDFPGAFRTAMGEFRDGIHIYVNGMLGASYIPLKDTDRRPDPFVNGDKDPDVTVGYEQQSFHGHDLAEKVNQALTLAAQPLQRPGLQWVEHPFQLPVTNARFKLAESLNIVEGRGISRGYVDTEITLVGLGELQLATLPGEMFPSGTGQIRGMLKAGARSQDPVMFLGIGNDWLGYLLSPAEYEDDKFSYHKGLSLERNAMDRIVKEYEKITAQPQR